MKIKFKLLTNTRTDLTSFVLTLILTGFILSSCDKKTNTTSEKSTDARTYVYNESLGACISSDNYLGTGNSASLGTCAKYPSSTFSDLDLSNQDLRGVDLKGSFLNKVTLDNANFDGAIFDSITFSDSNLNLQSFEKYLIQNPNYILGPGNKISLTLKKWRDLNNISTDATQIIQFGSDYQNYLDKKNQIESDFYAKLVDQGFGFQSSQTQSEHYNIITKLENEKITVMNQYIDTNAKLSELDQSLIKILQDLKTIKDDYAPVESNIAQIKNNLDSDTLTSADRDNFISDLAANQSKIIDRNAKIDDVLLNCKKSEDQILETKLSNLEIEAQINTYKKLIAEHEAAL